MMTTTLRPSRKRAWTGAIAAAAATVTAVAAVSTAAVPSATVAAALAVEAEAEDDDVVYHLSLSAERTGACVDVWMLDDVH